MENSSRTQNASRNLAVATICQVVNLALNFALRTFFVKFLGSEYLGVNGLFSNILSLLSFAELGIGNAIVFNLYKPLVKGDREEIKSILGLYKKAYTIIAIIVTVAGLAVIPFLDLFIKNPPQIAENLITIYLLFLAGSVLSYVNVYKLSLLIADQKNYIVLIGNEIFHVIQLVLQIAILYVWQSFIYFLLVQVICTFLSNLFLSRYTTHLYPYIKAKEQPLPKERKLSIFRDVKALAYYKFGSILLNSTDNILVSSFIGLSSVGIVSNYVLLHQACNSILGKIMDSFSASIGNLHVTATPKDKYEIFNRILLLVVWAYGFASVGIIVVSDYLIDNWLGSFYVLDINTVTAIIAGFFITGVHAVLSTFRNSMGFFTAGRFAPLLAAIMNLTLSIILCKKLGLLGIYMATPIARVCTLGIIDAYIIFKRGFNVSPFLYFIKSAYYVIIIVASGFLCRFIISSYIPATWTGVILSIIIVSVVYNGIMLLFQYRTKEFKGLLLMAKSIINAKKS